MIKLGDLNEKVPTGEGVKIPGRGIRGRTASDLCLRTSKESSVTELNE